MSATPYVIPLTDVIVPEDDVDATLAALAGGWNGAGLRVEAFEHAFADFTGAAHAIAVTSGTAALHLALLAAGIGPGDEVLVPGFTFVATAAAVRYCGAEPVLCDVASAANGLIDPEDAEARITPRTRAMVAVHMFGYPANAPALRGICDRHGITLIEDAAQAIGARLPGGSAAGTCGAMGCFSLFSKKQLCTGEGGMVVTDDAGLAARVRALRDPATPGGTGLPQSLSEAHAALGLNRLPRLAGDLEVRRAGVRAYRERLAGLPGIRLTFDDAAVEAGSHFAFPVLAADGVARDALKAALRASGIQTTNYPSLTRLSAYAGTRSLPRCEAVADRHLCLPLSSHSTEQQVALVAASVAAAL